MGKFIKNLNVVNAYSVEKLRTSVIVISLISELISGS